MMATTLLAVAALVLPLLPGVAGPTVDVSSPRHGGVLRVGMLQGAEQNLDPDKEYNPVTWELFRCCLLRTLLSYNGKPTAEGGTVLSPHLASAMPTQSDDGLTWTFHLKPGIHYAPPFEDTEVTAVDFIRALNREADPVASGAGAYAFYYSVIAGFDDYAAGRADTITGLEAPDDHTLVVRLNEPAGDLGYHFSLPATAPIPPNPLNPTEPMGAAQGLEAEYGRHLVATGPYMLEGSGDMDFTQPPLLQPGVAGYQPGRSIALVPNPSWDPATDRLRPAFADRIEILIPELQPTEHGDYLDRLSIAELAVLQQGGFLGQLTTFLARLSDEVEAGKLDLVLDANPPPNQADRYASEPSLTKRLYRDPANRVRFMEMNLAVPPFDDPHVRRAVNLVFDKGAVRGFAEQLGHPGEVADHLAPDSLESDLLASAAGYPHDVAAARERDARLAVRP